jgi:ribose transport system permease protein
MNDAAAEYKQAVVASEARGGWARRLPSGPVLGLTAVLLLFITLLQQRGELGHFLSWGNAQVLLHRSSIPAAVGLGMLIVVVTGGIDLSVGSVAALVTVVTMAVYNAMEARGAGVAAASLAAVAAGVGVGGLCGMVNGCVIAGLRVTPFVATLGMLTVARGVAFWLSDRRPETFRGARPGWVDAVSRAASPYLVDPGVWSVLLLALFVAALLRFSVFGRYCYALGSSEATARLCGVSVGRQKIAVYTLAGLLTGWAGVLTFAHSQSGDPKSSEGLELDVIAAVVIGGASLAGGRGTVAGTLLGVLILGIVENGVSFCNVVVEVRYVLIGVILVANTALGGWRSSRGGE